MSFAGSWFLSLILLLFSLGRGSGADDPDAVTSLRVDDHQEAQTTGRPDQDLPLLIAGMDGIGDRDREWVGESSRSLYE
jgi:hypothetical protein